MNVSTASNVTFVPGSWTWYPCVFLITTLTGFFSCAFILFVFVTSSVLRAAPFNVYLINLLTANLDALLIRHPLDMVQGLAGRWPFGEAVCTFHLYVNQIVNVRVALTVKLSLCFVKNALDETWDTREMSRKSLWKRFACDLTFEWDFSYNHDTFVSCLYSCDWSCTVALI